MRMKRGLLMNVLTVVMLFFVLPSTGMAQSSRYIEALGLNKDIYYDIYLGGGDEVASIIRNVKIVDIREVGGMIFLVINSSGFQLTQSEGLIALNHIRAILPGDKFVHTPFNPKNKISP